MTNLALPPSPPEAHLRSSTILAYCATWKSTLRTFFLRSILIFLALSAYLSVLKVSSKVSLDGDTLAIITVRQFPPATDQGGVKVVFAGSGSDLLF
jgi:hypothetical protein